MKKRNFITGFSAAFVALITLASCGGIRAKDGVVLTINGKEYTAKELYEDQKTPAAAEAKFNAVYKVAVRRYFEKGQEGYVYHSEIERDTKNKVAGAKAEAQSNADKNGTKYSVEWEKILSTNGVDDEAGLYDKFEYDLEKEKFEDKFYENAFKKDPTEAGYTEYKTNYDVLRNGGHFIDYNTGTPYGKTGEKIRGYLNEKQPYHMKHILVKIGAKENDDVTGEITAEQATKLYKIAKSLVQGNLSFEGVSDLFGEDDKTAQGNHASLGIMSRDTSFVNDFKLGTYLYEAAYGSSTSSAEEKGKGYEAKKAETELFGERTEEGGKYYKEGTAGYYADLIRAMADPTSISNQIGQIPYEAFELLKPQSEVGLISDIKGIGDMDFSDSATKERFSTAGVNTDEVKAKYLPRNVIFNKYFNKHRVMVITPTKINETWYGEKTQTTTPASKYLEVSKTSGKIVRSTSDDNFDWELDSRVSSQTGFNMTAKNNDIVTIGENEKVNQKVLRDNNGRTILVFRTGNGSASSSNADTYQGIHFIVIERSPFIGRENEGGTSTADESWTSLNDYYTEYYPSQTSGNHPKYDSGTEKGKDKLTFANYVNNDKLENQKKRSDTVKSELKKADDNLNTYLFDYLYSKGDLSFTTTTQGTELKNSIENWISINKRESSEYEKNSKWNETWKSYYYSLKSREENRAHVSGEVTRLIPEICVYAFRGEKVWAGDTEVTDLTKLFGKGGAFYE